MRICRLDNGVDAFRPAVPGNYLRVDRTNRSLHRTNFAKLCRACPRLAGQLAERQAASTHCHPHEPARSAGGLATNLGHLKNHQVHDQVDAIAAAFDDLVKLVRYAGHGAPQPDRPTSPARKQ